VEVHAVPVGNVLAIVFDFDDTLAPDSTTKLLQHHGIDPDKFWKEDTPALVKQGYDPAIAWLNLLLDCVGPDKPLGNLTNQALREFGASLDDDYFPGLPELFDDLQREVAEERDISIEFYIVSGGLRELLLGSAIVQRYFQGVYASELGEGQDGLLRYIKRCVTFTEKTRYLFEINKGIPPDESRENPLLVNKDVPPDQRRVPFEDMIYVGDGLTDIPCFSLLQKSGGTTFGVFDPVTTAKAKRAFLELLQPRRVVSIHAPKFGPTDDLGALLRVAIAERIASIKLRTARPY
jgi:phosphoserine phosphatase